MNYAMRFWLAMGSVLGLFGGGIWLTIAMFRPDLCGVALIVGSVMLAGGLMCNTSLAKTGIRVAVLLILLLSASSANADWTRLSGDHYSDGAWVYRAWYNCGWHYEKLYPAPTSSDDKFWDDAVRNEGAIERSDQKRDYLEKRFGSRARGAGPYAAAYGTASDSYSVATQGVAPGYATGGTTLYGVAGYQPALRIDPNPAIARQQRANERALDYGKQANDLSNQLIAQVVEGNTAEAKIRAAGEITVATIRAANNEQASTVTTSTRTWPQYPAASPQTSPAGGENRPAPPTAEEMRPSDGINGPQKPDPNSQSSVELDRTYALAQVGFQSCAKCHATAKPKADTLIKESVFASMDQEAREVLAQHVWDSTDPTLPASKRMPKGKPEALANSIREAMRFEILHPRGNSLASNY